MLHYSQPFEILIGLGTIRYVVMNTPAELAHCVILRNSRSNRMSVDCRDERPVSPLSTECPFRFVERFELFKQSSGIRYLLVNGARSAKGQRRIFL